MASSHWAKLVKLQPVACLAVAGWLAVPRASLGDFVSASVTGGAAAPDLTALGRIDWAVWGYAMDGTSTSVVPSPRKKGASAIGNLSWLNPGGGAFLNGRAALATHLLTWSDGVPTPSESGATAGLRHQEFGSFLIAGGGFSFQVPAVRATRKLSLFVTAKECTGRMTATLGATSVTRFLHAPGATQAGLFEIHFHADAPGTSVLVEFSTEGPVSGCELAIHAVTLDEPYVIRPTSGSTGLSLLTAISQVPSGGRITFAPELDGQTVVIRGQDIQHESGIIEIDKNVSIDASDLRAGIKVAVSDRLEDSFRLILISITANGSLTLDSVEFTRFERATLIQCAGQLQWTRGAITDCATAYVDLPLVRVGGSATLDRVTIADNPASVAVRNEASGQTTLSSCTITRNNTGVTSAAGGSGTLTIRNSVVAGNDGENNVSGPCLEEGNNLLNGDPGLGPVKDNGGKVRTALPAPASPAATGGDPAAPGTPTSDARGVVPTVPGGIPIGAAGLGSIASNANDSGPGSLRQAIADAPGGGGVCVESSVGLINLLSTISCNKQLTISGANLSGQGTVRALEVTAAGNLTFVGGSVTQGKSGGGGGISNGGGSLDLRDTTVSGNTASSSSGGGISASTGSKTWIRGTRIEDNLCSGTTSSPAGAGIYAASNTQTWITNSTVSRNRIDSSFTSVSGGGINVNGTLTIINSTISNNQAPRAGGIYVNSSSVTTIANSTFTGNTAPNGGGGIYLQGSLTIANSVVGGNSATTGAPDLHKGTSSSAKIASEGANLLSTNTGTEDVFPAGPLVGTAAAPLSAKLTALGPWVAGAPPCHLPLPGSPVVCAAQATLTLISPAADQTGLHRHGNTTLGATEARPFSALNLTDLNGNGVGDLLEPSYPPGIGAGDFDADGFGDVTEITAMTDPTSGTSFPRISAVQPPLAPAGAWLVHGKSFPGVGYRIESSPDPGFANPVVVFEFTADSLSFQAPFHPPPGTTALFVRFLVDP